MVTEKWKDVVGYEGYYQVSDQGRVRSVDRTVPHGKNGLMSLKGQLLQPRSKNKYGYLQVTLWKNRTQKAIRVHQLVTAAFLGPCPKGQQVRHGVGRGCDNRLINLCYGTPKDQYRDKIRDGAICDQPVRRSDGREYKSITEAAGTSRGIRSHISAVCRGRRKTAGGYSWEYITEKSNV